MSKVERVSAVGCHLEYQWDTREDFERKFHKPEPTENPMRELHTNKIYSKLWTTFLLFS